MNGVQLDIFKHFVSVCSSLNLTYYMVHGSLLGAVQRKGFFPFDDDIDVAMPRADYNKLLQEGQHLLPSYLFLQSYETEKQFPLAFAKIRNSNTAFIQPIHNRTINQGIYIDIFPMDNYPAGKWKQKFLALLERMYQARILAGLSLDGCPVWKRILSHFSKWVFPSWEKAVRKRAQLYASFAENGRVIIVGGKSQERGIGKNWFAPGVYRNFEGMQVNCPVKYEKYLSCIYGDFKNYHPMGKYLNADKTATVSAEQFSTTRSYKDFL